MTESEAWSNVADAIFHVIKDSGMLSKEFCDYIGIDLDDLNAAYNNPSRETCMEIYKKIMRG